MEDSRSKIIFQQRWQRNNVFSIADIKTNPMPPVIESQGDKALVESSSRSGREEGEIPETLTVPFNLLRCVVKGLLEKLDIFGTDLSSTLVSSLVKGLTNLAGVNVDVCGFQDGKDTVSQIVNEAHGMLAQKNNLKANLHKNNLIASYVTAVLSAVIINYMVMRPKENVSTESGLLGSDPGPSSSLVRKFSINKELAMACSAFPSPSLCKTISKTYQNPDQGEMDGKRSGDWKTDDTPPSPSDVRPKKKGVIQVSLSKLFTKTGRRVAPSS